MSYEKTVWTKGDIITSEKLNKIEKGIQDASDNSNVATPDWNQNDPNGDGYIANRPFYIAGETNTEIVNDSFSFNNSNQSAPITFDTENILEILKNGAEFTAYYDGTYYSGEIINKDTYYFIGNCSIMPGMTSEDNVNMPFLFLIAEAQQVIGGLILKDSYTGEKNISISIKTYDVHKIDSKYLPDSNFELSDRMAKGVDDNGTEVKGAVIEGMIEDFGSVKKNKATGVFSHAEGSVTTASGSDSHAEGYQTTASGDYSHAEGSSTKASGNNSHAEGLGATASVANSHAEGGYTTASGERSHAEGDSTTASGDASHAEGQGTKASGMKSHAEGQGTIASGNNSHAEGLGATASGNNSHAEGLGATASGNGSHAEGGGTIAKHKSQHVFGEYNVEDPSTAKTSERGTYVEIVGNGTSNNNRSNARILDWSGNEQLAGSLTLGLGTADESTITAAQLKQLLTLESDVESLLAAI